VRAADDREAVEAPLLAFIANDGVASLRSALSLLRGIDEVALPGRYAPAEASALGPTGPRNDPFLISPPVDARLADVVPLGSVLFKRWMFSVLNNSGAEVWPSAEANAHVCVVTRTARGAEERVQASDALLVSAVRRRLWSEANLRFLVGRDAASDMDQGLSEYRCCAQIRYI